MDCSSEAELLWQLIEPGLYRATYNGIEAFGHSATEAMIKALHLHSVLLSLR